MNIDGKWNVFVCVCALQSVALVVLYCNPDWYYVLTRIGEVLRKYTTNISKLYMLLRQSMLFDFGWESGREPLFSFWVILQFYFRPLGNIRHIMCIIHLQGYYFPWAGCLCLMWRFLILQHQWRCENYVPTFLLYTLEVTIWKRKKLKFTDKSFTRRDEGGGEKSGLKLVFCFQSWKPNLLLSCLRTAWGMH